jgi:hypothetical protein
MLKPEIKHPKVKVVAVMLQLMMGSTQDSTLTPRTPDSWDSIKRRIKPWDNPDMGMQIMITFTQAAQLVLKILKKCFEQKQMNFTYHVSLFWGKKNTMAWNQVSNQGKRIWNIFHSQMYILTAMIVLKLSSARTISEALFATAVPEPIAIPMSAFFRAGASLTPSPVMATCINHHPS